jgi:hypothetical protein
VKYLYNVLLGIDMLGSTITGGIPGETLSGRAGISKRRGKLSGRIFSAIIDWLARNPNHCEEAIANDIRRATAVIADDSK